MISRETVALRITLLLVTLFSMTASAIAASRSNAMQIKILDSETQSISFEGSSVPRNCDQVNFDAYCNNSKTAIMTNTLLVQQGNDPPYRVSCTIDSRFSKCTPLPKGEIYEARREKRGITIYYIDDKGKARSQLYSIIGDDPKAPIATGANRSTLSTEPAAPAAGTASAASPAPATVKCNFSSTPQGAEVTLDGHYVGSTPSVVSLGTGNHLVQMTFPGFVNWKRDLTVSSGSELTVNAVLQKAQ
jgi:hypothetical protein